MPKKKAPNPELGSRELFEAALEGNPKTQYISPIGAYRTLSLFAEKNNTNVNALYTLKPFDWKGYTSFKRVYLEECDPIGYTFAEKYLYDFEHLQKLKSNKVLAPYFEKWDNEMEVKLRAEALKEVRELSKTKGATGLAAAKFLSEKKWEYKGKGRPKKEDIERRVKQDADLQRQLEEDYILLKEEQ